MRCIDDVQLQRSSKKSSRGEKLAKQVGLGRRTRVIIISWSIATAVSEPANSHPSSQAITVLVPRGMVGGKEKGKGCRHQGLTGKMKREYRPLRGCFEGTGLMTDLLQGLADRLIQRRPTRPLWAGGGRGCAPRDLRSRLDQSHPACHSHPEGTIG